VDKHIYNHYLDEVDDGMNHIFAIYILKYEGIW